MTDKQIIIDGVDVSGCKKYGHEIIRCNTTLKNICFCGGRCTDKKNSDCDYKKLKRAEYELQIKEQALDEIETNILEYEALILGKPITMRESDCVYNIIDIIKKSKRRINVYNSYKPSRGSCDRKTFRFSLRRNYYKM